MTSKPARPAGYGYEYVPAMDSPKGKTEPNWRVSDPFDNRIATCYDEANCRTIVAALNGASIASDPAALDVIHQQVAELRKLAQRNGGPAGAELLHRAAVLERAARALGPGAPTREIRREGALESDPYAIAGFSFADLVDRSRDETTFEDMTRNAVPRRVRDRVFDDVLAAHNMLDAAGIASGPLTARIGLALLPRIIENGATILGVADHATTIADAREGKFRRPLGAAPLADVDNVKIPEPDEVLALLDQLTAEEAFRVFDHVKVLPGNTAEARNWNLTDADDTRRMVAECCAVALNTGKLGELAKAARAAVDRKGAR